VGFIWGHFAANREPYIKEAADLSEAEIRDCHVTRINLKRKTLRFSDWFLVLHRIRRDHQALMDQGDLFTRELQLNSYHGPPSDSS